MPYFIFLAIVLTFGLGKADECKTPNNETGQCISLFSCTVILNGLSDPSSKEFMQKSKCGDTAIDPLVCCGSQSNFITEGKKTDSRKLKNHLASKAICGFQHSDDFDHTVNTTVVTEFPWLALIAYKYKNAANIPNQYLCSGSLINTRYILTAAYCLEPRAYKPVRIRLGEYHIKNDTDCIDDSNTLECSESVQDFDIERIIVHPEFTNAPHPINDIGLIRLNRLVRYSDYIRPICLPLTGIKGAQIGDIIVSSGWGRMRSHNTSEIKKRVFSSLITNKECEEKYLEGNRTLTLKDHICGLVTADSEISCHGDGGGPVMFNYKRQWVQEGIVSFGSSDCFRYPDVSTKVASYMDWIQENLEP